MYRGSAIHCTQNILWSPTPHPPHRDNWTDGLNVHRARSAAHCGLQTLHREHFDSCPAQNKRFHVQLGKWLPWAAAEEGQWPHLSENCGHSLQRSVHKKRIDHPLLLIFLVVNGSLSADFKFAIVLLNLGRVATYSSLFKVAIVLLNLGRVGCHIQLTSRTIYRYCPIDYHIKHQI
jgi:hypothetical protein